MRRRETGNTEEAIRGEVVEERNRKGNTCKRKLEEVHKMLRTPLCARRKRRKDFFQDKKKERNANGELFLMGILVSRT